MPRAPAWALLLAAAVVAAAASTACNGDGSSASCACEKENGVVVKVDCTNANLGEVPEGIPATVKRLLLAQNEIRLVESQAFNALPHLEVLHLQGNRVATIESGAFAGLPKLQQLWMSDNGLQSLPAGVFSPLIALQTLLLARNSLQALPGSIFQGLDRLSALDLSGNSLDIPDASAPVLLGSLTSLRSLDLSFNGLRGLHSQLLDKATRLTDLRIQSNLIQAIQPGAFAATAQLVSLDASHNLLSSVDAVLTGGSLAQLEHLKVANNRLRSLAAGSLDGLDRLSTLDLSGNQIATLPTNVFSAVTDTLTLVFLADNPLNCCGMEWLRDTLSQLQDGPNLLCARPLLVKGTSLTATAGAVGHCQQDEPETPERPTASEGTATSVRVSWGPVDGNALAVEHYTLAVRANGGPPAAVQCPGGRVPERTDDGLMTMQDCVVLAVDPLTRAAVSPLTLVVVGLAPFAEYEFSVTAHSAAYASAAGEYSGAVSTLQAAPSTPSPPVVADVVQTQARVTITEPRPANGVVTGYNLTLRDLDRSTSSYLLIEGADIAAGTGASAVLAGLDPYTRYEVAVAAITVAPGPQSAASAFRTAIGPPPTGPVFSVSDTTSTSISFAWAPLTQAEAHGPVTKYELEYDGGGGPERVSIAPSSSAYTLRELTPGTVYNVSMRAHTSAGPGVSSRLTHSTLSAAPGAMEPPTVVDVSATSVAVGFLPPSHPNGVVVAYMVYVRVAGSLQQPTRKYSGGAGTLAVTIGGLEPATTYEVTVTASTALQDGESAPSTPALATTSEAAPSAVSQPQVQASDTAVGLEWTPPDKSNGVIVSYEVIQIFKIRRLPFYDDVEDTARRVLATVSGNTTSTTIVGLEPATNYTFAVLAKTSAGLSEPAETASIVTADAVSSRPGAPAAVVVSSSSVELSWEQPLMPNGNITKYVVSETRVEKRAVYSGMPGAVLSVTVDGLAPDTLFEFEVVAFTVAGASKSSHTVVARTHAQDDNITQTIIIVIVVLFIVILAAGYSYELAHRQRKIAVAKGLSDLVEQQAPAAGGGTPAVAANSFQPNPSLPMGRLPTIGQASFAPQPSGYKPPPRLMGGNFAQPLSSNLPAPNFGAPRPRANSTDSVSSASSASSDEGGGPAMPPLRRLNQGGGSHA